MDQGHRVYVKDYGFIFQGCQPCFQRPLPNIIHVWKRDDMVEISIKVCSNRDLVAYFARFKFLL